MVLICLYELWLFCNVLLVERRSDNRNILIQISLAPRRNLGQFRLAHIDRNDNLFWSRTSNDVTIEQSVPRSDKTQGRLIDNSVRNYNEELIGERTKRVKCALLCVWD